MCFVKRFIAILGILMIFSCSNEKDIEPKEENPYNVNNKLILPTEAVSVYPLGEPGLSNYFSKLERDNNDIIILDVHGNATTYEPGMIAKFVMASYRNYLRTSNNDILLEGLKHSDWLVDNFHCDTTLGYWLLEAPLDSLVVWESPFKSAMTNGLSIFALIQMITYTDRKEEYLQTIECALNSFNYDISDHGVSSITDDYHWFEEYAMQSRSKVLNGGIFALTGVWAAKEYLNSSLATELFDKMIAAIKLRLPEYDYGHTTLYHTSFLTGKYVDFGRPVHGQYNEIHALQLQWLFSLTGNKLFLDYAKKFYKYESYELKQVLIDNKVSPKLVDLYKYHSYEVITRLNNLELELKSDHKLREVHIFYYGYHKTLPIINILASTGNVNNISATDIKYFQDGNHHTSIGIYKIESKIEVINTFELEFLDYTYTDNYDRNLLRQVEVITNDNDVYFTKMYEKWAKQGSWSRKFK